MAKASFPVKVAGGVPIVTAPEEIDATNAARLRAAVLDAAARGNGTLVVDMSQTQFCDSAGLHVLVRAHHRAQTEGGEALLVISAAPVLRIFAVTGIDRMIPNFSTLEEALAQTPEVPDSLNQPATLPRAATHRNGWNPPNGQPRPRAAEVLLSEDGPADPLMTGESFK